MFKETIRGSFVLGF